MAINHPLKTSKILTNVISFKFNFKIKVLVSFQIIKYAKLSMAYTNMKPLIQI